MPKNVTILLIIGYIQENELFNFNSLSDKAQRKLKKAYGEVIETDVNSALYVMRGGVAFIPV